MVNELPIIYIRGYAGPTAGINTAVDDPFYGFNLGATHVRVDGTDQPKFYQFEGPMLRLMIDHGYQLLVHGDQQAFLQSRPPRGVAPESIWVYRFYDQAATTFRTPPHRGVFQRLFTDVEQRVTTKGFDVESAAEGLLKLIDLVGQKVDCADKRVIIVAHSMGGLIARCMIQKIAPKHGRSAKDLVAKLFTYGTPHGGIVFENGALNWVEDAGGPAGSEMFAPQRMYGYLDPEHSFGDEPTREQMWDPQTVPQDAFDTDDIFCLVGTDFTDYGATRQVVGPRSDGLVLIDHAYVRKAHRAFVFKSHSGSYGEVNSEEGYQNLRRFLFGRWKVAIDLVGLPTDLPGADERGCTPVWQADMRLAVRGVAVVLSEQRADQYNPIQLNTELARKAGDPDPSVPVASTFLLDLSASEGNRPATAEDEVVAAHGGIARYSLTLKVAKQWDCPTSFDFGEHLEQVFDWADTAIFDVGAGTSGSGLRAWANWNTEIPSAIDDFDPLKAGQPPREITTLSAGQWQFDLRLPQAARDLQVFGSAAALRVSVTDRTAAPAPDRDGARSPAGAGTIP